MHDGAFPVELVSGVPVVAAPEEVDITNAPQLRSALLEAAAGQPGTLVADLSLTRFCDASGVHALMAAHKHAQAEGGELLLVARRTTVLRIFALTGIDQVIPSFTSLQDALAHTAPDGGRGSGRGGPRSGIAGLSLNRVRHARPRGTLSRCPERRRAREAIQKLPLVCHASIPEPAEREFAG